jgi:simple sugar transport system permease protein
MGICDHHLHNVPAFIATLAGMFLTRGLCYVNSIEAINIQDPFYLQVSLFQNFPCRK